MLTLIFSNHWFIFWSRPTDTTHALFIPPFDENKRYYTAAASSRI